MISGSLAKNDQQLKASYVSWPPCTVTQIEISNLPGSEKRDPQEIPDKEYQTTFSSKTRNLHHYVKCIQSLFVGELYARKKDSNKRSLGPPSDGKGGVIMNRQFK